MTVLDRVNPPQAGTIEAAQLLQPHTMQLQNGIPVHMLNAGTQELVKIEFTFRAGSRYQTKPLVAHTTNNMLKEGTTNYSAAELADAVDALGAFLQTEVEKDMASIIVYTLNKHLKNVLPLVKEVICAPTFPEKELEVHLRKAQQSFIVESDSVGTLARRRFTKEVFGEDHPYGTAVKESSFENLSVEDLQQFYKEYYGVKNCNIIVAGKAAPEMLELLEANFGDWQALAEKPNSHVPMPSQAIGAECKEVKPDAIQSAIRIGRVMVTKHHKDFMPLQVLNATLGGYFGSRLMSNIREDKGYTYGIGSAMVALQDLGYFFITTEVGSDVCDAALKEIYFELKRLRETPMEAEELQLVKNYILGSFLRSTDGAFEQADRFLGVHNHGLSLEFYDTFVDVVKNVTAEELQRLAQEYLQEESLTQIVVGPE